MIAKFNEHRIPGLERARVLLLLLSSEQQFELTGSYRFSPVAAAYRDSDIDLFVQYSPEVKQWLLALGFQVLPRYSYANQPLDIDCVEVLRHHEARIDVQLSRVADHRRRANLAAEGVPWEVIPKSARSGVWNALLTMAS